MPDFDTLIELFEQELERRACSAHTIRAYGVDIRRFRDHFAAQSANQTAPAIEEFDACQYDVTRMREWLEGLHAAGLSNGTICRHIAAMKAFFHFVIGLGLLRSNPAKMLRRPKYTQRPPRVPSEKQTATIIDGVESLDRWSWPRDVAMLELLYGAGLRISELVGLNVDDIDQGTCWVFVRGKGQRERAVPYPFTSAHDALEKYLAVRDQRDDEPALFVNRHGRRLSDRGARAIVKAYAAKLGRDESLHPHSFRHAFATHMLDRGAGLRELQELLGHDNLRATARYTQVSLVKIVEVYDKSHPASM